MNKQRANKRLVIAAAICLLLGMSSSAVIVMATQNTANAGPGTLVVLLFLFALTALVIGAFSYGVYAFFVLGWLRLRDDNREVSELSDDNTVGDPEEGERKLNEYLSAITSVEARIGLLQRSAPYVPPEKRPPPDAKPPRTRLTPKGKRIFRTTLCMGAIAGMGIALIKGDGPPPSAMEGFQPVMLLRVATAGLVGLLLISPVALLLAAFHIEYREPDDAGTDRSEAA